MPPPSPASSDGAALLRAICDNPDEDTPRLAYADWLDEQGGESNIARAEFIRLQVGEAAKPVDWLNARSMTRRESRLFHTWAHTSWRWEIPEYPGLSIYDRNYERGFIYRVSAKSVQSFLNAATDLYTRIPITQVEFSSITPETAAELARSPTMARIRDIGTLTTSDDALAGLATSPHLGNVTSVNLSGREATAKGMLPLLANTSLTRVKDFGALFCDGFWSVVVSALVESPSAAALERVSVFGCEIGSDISLHLPALVRLPKLRSLNLGHIHGLPDEAAICLAGVSVTGAFHVSLSAAGITDRGAEAFLIGPFLRNSQVKLQLSSPRISAGMRAKLKEAFGDRVTV
jgi:uncharacterized protein (TIGR02996 family)